MTQLMKLETYIDLVKAVGIEEAYRQRNRATGVTFRAVLQAAHDISAGHKLVLSAELMMSRQRYFIKDVMEVMRSVQHELLCTEHGIQMPVSGGHLVTSGYARNMQDIPYIVLTDI